MAPGLKEVAFLRVRPLSKSVPEREFPTSIFIVPPTEVPVLVMMLGMAKMYTDDPEDTLATIHP